MKKLPVFFLDLQTTGANALEAYILEMALADQERLESFLVELPEGETIPRRIEMVTGIKNMEMENAISFPIALQKLKSYIPEGAVAVIHFAQFERPFLEQAFKHLNEELPFSIICTNEIAKRLYPNLPSRGIKALAGYFGHDSGEFKRAKEHVEATRTIWRELATELEKLGIENHEQFLQWISATPKAKKTKYEYPLDKNIRLNLPDEPGIYRMLNREGKVLYVGKATSLHSRVNSYFRGQKGRDSFKLEMLTMVHDIRVTVCETPLHAALLETDEIKRLNPYYNIALKEGYRSLNFFDSTYTSVSSIKDDVHTIGPFSNTMTFDSVFLLNLWLMTEYPSPPTFSFFYHEYEAETVKAGFELFCETFHIDPIRLINRRSLMALGLKLYRRNEELVEIEVDEEADVTPEDIAHKFERHFVRIGEALVRAKKIQQLLNADVEFKTKTRKKIKLSIRNGKINSDEVESEANAWMHSPIETYDRLTVLLTELQKYKSVKITTLEP